MKRLLACTFIMPFAVSLTLFLTVMAGTKAEAASASSVEAARQKMLDDDRKKNETMQDKRKKEEEMKKAKRAHASELVRSGKVPGFIALAEYGMTYTEAVAFCKRNGGRLPRVNNSNMWDGKNPPWRGVLVDGFGYGGRPWDEVGLPVDIYWTGTAVPRRSAGPEDVMVVNALGSVVTGTGATKVVPNSVVCVP